MMKRLARRSFGPALAMASGTLVSRATGLARTSGLAAVLGVGLLSDAYTAASAVPTMVLVLVTGGTLSSALVPMLSRAADESERRRSAGTALIAMSALGGLASVGLALAAPVLARLLSAGAQGEPGHDVRVRAVTTLLVLMAPQVLLLAVTAVTSALLTAQGRLGVVGWAPVATNLTFLSALVLYAAAPVQSVEVTSAGLVILGAGSTVATAIGCAIQLRAATSALPRWRHVLVRPDADFVRELRRTGGWTLLYAVANQVGLLVVLAVAARRDGVGSVYQWSFTVMQLPFALIGVTLLSATLPALARAADDRPAFDRLVHRSSALLLVLLLPCAAGLALFAPQTATLLVGYGATDRDATALVAQGIRLFAAALLPFAAFQLLTRSCYALRKPKWPALTNIAVNAVTVAGALLALRPESGPDVLRILVVSYAASYALGCAVLSAALRTVGVKVAAGLRRPALTAGLATAAGVAVVLGLRASLADTWLLQLVCLVAFGVSAVLGALPWLRPAAPLSVGSSAAR